VDEDIINLLNLKENDAVMEIDETVYLDDGTPCEVNIAIINTRIFPCDRIRAAHKAGSPCTISTALNLPLEARCGQPCASFTPQRPKIS
jgi:hypothetical protein